MKDQRLDAPNRRGSVTDEAAKTGSTAADEFRRSVGIPVESDLCERCEAQVGIAMPCKVPGCARNLEAPPRFYVDGRHVCDRQQIPIRPRMLAANEWEARAFADTLNEVNDTPPTPTPKVEDSVVEVGGEREVAVFEGEIACEEITRQSGCYGCGGSGFDQVILDGKPLSEIEVLGDSLDWWFKGGRSIYGRPGIEDGKYTLHARIVLTLKPAANTNTPSPKGEG